MSLFSRIFGRTQDVLSRPSATARHQGPAWPFDQAPNAAAITTRQVLEGNEEIHVVLHYSDDHSWAFLCGTTDQQEDGRVITMREALALDETVQTISDLPPGWKAWRAKRGEPWHREENFERG